MSVQNAIAKFELEVKLIKVQNVVTTLGGGGGDIYEVGYFPRQLEVL